MGRNYAALPHDYLDELADLTDAELGRLIRALLVYSKTGREEELSGGEKYLWRRVRSQEDRFQESYESTSNAKKEAGKKGAAKRWQAMADDSKEWQNIAEDSKEWQAIASDSKNGYTETNTKTETETILQLASASRENNAPVPAREAGSLPKRRYGQYALLEFHEYCELLNTLGHSELSRRINLVDLPENEGKDFFKLISEVRE